jgi:hypothetical protein
VTNVDANDDDFRSWRWDDQERWKEIVRAACLLGLIKDTNMTTMHKLRAILRHRIEQGKIRQIGERGPYQLVECPPQAEPIETTALRVLMLEQS